jgi:colanic acid/amylovoran biosynthesis glycosyltransferase
MDYKIMTSNVVYSVASWLPLTMNWIFTQIKFLADFTPLILTETIINTDKLPSYPTFSINNKLSKLFFANLRRAGVRLIPSVFKDALNKYSPSVLHSHFGDWGWYDIPMAKKFSLKQIVSFYGYDLSLLPTTRPKWKRRYLDLFDNAQYFLCEGPHMAHTLINLGCPQEKVIVYRLGIDLDQIPFKPRYLMENGDIRILIAGRFLEKKGIPYALDAVGQLKHHYPQLRVTLIGDSIGTQRDEREKSKIFEIIHRHSMESYVSLRGFQPLDILISEMHKHHIFLSPSVSAFDGDSEGGAPVTIIQALASGLPVISTTHCDIPGVVTHAVSGLLASERDVDGLMTYIKWLIDNYQQWPNMGKAGRAHVEKHFNARIQGQQLRKIYDCIG